MNAKSLLILAAGLTFASAAHASLDVSLSAEIRLGRTPPPPPPDIVVLEPVGPPAPPPWAATHWYKRNRAYYYYPDCGVYYRPADRVWFYLEGDTWRAGAALPAFVSIDFGRSISLTLETDRPYVFHQHVVAYYPRGYFAKVKFRGEPPRSGRPPERPARADRDRDHDDRPPGHVKARGKDRDK